MLPVKQAILPAFHHFLHPKNTPIVFLHGFLGSRKNFQNMSKTFSKYLECTTYTFDARNHGASMHCLPMDYPSMTSDLATLLNHEKIDKVTLVSYSMGAKTAMNYALKHPGKVERLVCIDNAPVIKSIGDDFTHYIEVLKDILRRDWSHVEHKKIPKLMQQLVKRVTKDDNLTLYLLANVSKIKNKLISKIPLEIMDDSVLEAMGDFPLHTQPVNVPTLFIKAAHSQFIDDFARDECTRLFPNSSIKTVDSDHAEILVDHYATIKTLVEEFLEPSYR